MRFVNDDAPFHGLSPEDLCVYINYACSELEYSTRAFTAYNDEGELTSVRIQANAHSPQQRYGNNHYHRTPREFQEYTEQRLVAQRGRSSADA